jgi:hypothetical protein
MRVATTYQIKNNRDGAEYMTCLTRVQGSAIFAPLRESAVRLSKPSFSQRRKARKDSLQFQEGD